MTRVHVGEHTVRVWSTKDKLTSGPVPEVMALSKLDDPTLTEISSALDALENVAAYEILDGLGNGALVYPDWG